MAVSLRLKRMGKRHSPFYRLNAMDSRAKRDGRVIEELGYYDPANKDPERKLKINKERIEYWLSVGAQPSDTVRNLCHKIGIDIEPTKRPTVPSRAEREAAEQAQAADSAEAPKKE